MIPSVTKTVLAASLAVVALVLASPSYADRGKPSPKSEPTAATATVPVQGVVQSVSGSAVVVRQLDGSTVSIGIGRTTHITVDGRPTRIGDVKPGYVLVTTVKAGQAASTMRFLRPS
jgi:hypothetical protein